MKYTLIFAALLSLNVGLIFGQTLPKAETINRFWPEGEKRIYRFTVDDLEIGRLEAVMNDIGYKNGSVRCVLSEKLTLDLSGHERGYIMGVDGELIINDKGALQSAEIEIRIDDRKQKIDVAYNAEAGEIIARRDGDNRTPQKIVAPEAVFALDNYMMDQWELALSQHALAGGKRIIINGFSTQGIYMAEYEFLVLGKVQVQYGSFTDSVWQVNLIRPGTSTIYIDRMHRIVKVHDSSQNLVVEAVVDPFARRRSPPKSLVERINDQIIRMPIYGLYLFTAFIWLLFLGRDSYRIGWSYLLFIIGGLVYPVIYITQAPLQQQYAVNVLGPALWAGESIVIPAMIPALLTGLIQESLKFIPLFIVARMVRPRAVALISMGAFIGAGFGFIEASYIIAPAFQERLLTSYMLIERVFTILSHTVMGALLGYGLARKKIWQFWLAAVGLHGLGNYMVVFVQAKILTIKGLNIILGFYDIALLAGIIYLQSTFKKYQLSLRKAKR